MILCVVAVGALAAGLIRIPPHDRIGHVPEHQIRGGIPSDRKAVRKGFYENCNDLYNNVDFIS